MNVKKTKRRLAQPPPAPPPRVFNHVLWTRVGMILTMSVAIGAAAFAMVTRPELIRVERYDALKPARQRIDASARAVARAWRPEQRSRALAQLVASGDTDKLKLALKQALAERDQPLRRALMACAVELKAHEVRGEVSRIAFSGASERGDAIIAAHRLEKWSRSELAEFLSGQDVLKKIAALDSIARYGGELPEREWVACLTSEDSEVRAAALRAMPQWPSTLLVAEFEGILAQGSGEAIAQVVRALARSSDPDRFEAAVTDLLGSPHEVARKAALTFLRALGRKPKDADRIWQLLSDPSASAEVRAMALLCLERHGACPIAELRTQLPLLGPLERLFAARCLIAADQPDATEVLMPLLGEERQPEVAEAARRLLAWFSGANPAATADEFRAAIAKQGRRVRRILPEHGLALE